LDAKWILHVAKFRYGARAPENVYSVPAQETAKHRVKFGWPPVSDVAAVTNARCETRRNFLGCPKQPNRSQPLLCRSSPNCGDMWRRYCCLTDLSERRYMPSLRRYSPTKLCDGAQMAIFCAIFASCISSEPPAAGFRHAF